MVEMTQCNKYVTVISDRQLLNYTNYCS